MSDFLFSSKRLPEGKLTLGLASIYPFLDSTDMVEYHGQWGALGVSKSRYNGFDPIETEDCICVVIGGPVLYFQHNRFLSGEDRQAGTRAIYERWGSGEMDWSKDLSGPFAILLINKITRKVTCITDLMMFIPVYRYHDQDGIALGTHIDALAKICGQQGKFDQVSLVDFIIHRVITYPYTAYGEVKQCHPAAVHLYCPQNASQAVRILSVEPYWLPVEKMAFNNLEDAAKTLRNGVEDYILRVTESMHHVAQFMSAGEDSRAVSGIIPKRLKRDAFIFLDYMNKEGRIAKKIASSCEASFNLSYRGPAHYISILPEAASLIGSGHEYFHAHALGFDRKHGLADYNAVFGGYLADSLIKAQYSRKGRRSCYLIWLLDVFLPGESHSNAVDNPLFSGELLEVLTVRRREHLKRVQELRPISAHEWFVLWPMTMRATIPNLYSNRRLFASYEPFMSKDVIQVSVGVPTDWKLNRRLFNQAFHPFLAKTKWLRHPNGHFPYYPWYVNSPIELGTQLVTRLFRKLEARTGLRMRNQGPWGDWQNVVQSPEWEKAVEKALNNTVNFPEIHRAIRFGALSGPHLTIQQKADLLQTSYLVESTM